MFSLLWFALYGIFYTIVRNVHSNEIFLQNAPDSRSTAVMNRELLDDSFKVVLFLLPVASCFWKLAAHRSKNDKTRDVDF